MDISAKIISESVSEINMAYKGLTLTEWHDSSTISFDCDLLFLDLEFGTSYSGYHTRMIARQLENARESIESFLRSDGAIVTFISQPVYFSQPGSGQDSYIYNRDVLEEVGVSLEMGGIREYDCTPVLDEERLHEYLNYASTSNSYPTYSNHEFEKTTELVQRGEQGKVCGVAFEGIQGTGNGALVALPRPDNLTVRPDDWFIASLRAGLPHFPDHVEEKLTEAADTDQQEPSEPQRSPREQLRNIFNRFHLVSEQLEYRHNDRETLSIEYEYDVQDLLHSLLWLEFDDIRDEDNAPSHAGSSSRIDFLLKDRSIGVEVKMAYEGHTEKKLKNEISEDKEHYKKHPDCEKLFIFVYDPYRKLRNPHGFEKDLSSESGPLSTEVIINPK